MSAADDAILSEFVEACKERFKDKLVCVFHHGSYARGEAVPGRSDVDTMVILRTVEKEELKALRQILSNFPRFQTFLLSLRELENLPKENRLQFFVGRKVLYGRIEIEPPTRDDLKNYMYKSLFEVLHIVRHWYLLPHDPKHVAKGLYYQLKMCDFCLRTYLFYETDSYPMTRKEVVKRLSKMENMEEGISVINMLENWDSVRAKAEENPDEFLIIIEKFAREQIDRLSKI